MRRRPPPSSRAASFLIVVGVLGVLGFTFMVGVVAGRHWPRLLPWPGRAAAPRLETEPGPRRDARLGERSRAAEPAPVLTFYHELTAPLSAAPPPPPAPKPRRGEAPRPPAAASPAPEEPRPPEAAPPVPPAARRFTIQVGAFKTREQAEALRAMLAGTGHEAYVAELEAPAGARYRVRIGAFATREEARETAQRLTSERQLSAYVTVR